MSLSGKLSLLQSHHVTQAEEYETHLHARRLQQQLYESKLQQRKNLIVQRNGVVVGNNAHLSRLSAGAAGMTQQLRACESKLAEFRLTLARNEEVFDKYLEQERAMKEMIVKLERECEVLQQELAQTEAAVASALQAGE